MKTTGIRSNASVSPGRAKGAKGTSGAAFDALLKGAADRAASGVGAAAPVSALVAPFAVDAADPNAPRRRAVDYGDDLLNQLENLRRAILSGRVDVAQVRHLLARMRDRQERTHDARLDEILSEIELRVEIEAAKLDRARGE